MQTVDTLRRRVEAGETFEYVLFWGHTPRNDGTVGKECFSQWYGAEFTLDGVTYYTAEHYMMAGKARLFGDHETLGRILAAATPAEAKQLGRGVRNFNEAAWKAARVDIVVAGNMGKFGQNAELARVLLDTGEHVLVEAAPNDRIWGIGLGAKDPGATDPHQWCGSNLLGFALMEVRARLRR